MRKMPFLITVGMLVLLGGLRAGYAQTGVTYSYFYVAGQNSYTVPTNATVIIPLYLEEVNSDQSTSSLLASEHGLSAAGVNVSYFSGSAGATITNAAANKGAVPNGFDDPASTGTVDAITSATITESTDPFPFGTDTVGVEPGTQINGVSEVLLGTVTIQGGSLAGQTTVFTAGVVDPRFGSTFTNDHNYDLDNSGDPLNPAGASSLYFSAASTNFTVTTTAVPEPASVSLLFTSCLILLRTRRRRC